MNKILIVEDNPYKLEKIKEVIDESFEVEIDEAYSFTTGWQKLRELDYDLVCLDMSLPTFEPSALSGGGVFRAFGGRELARKMSKRGMNTKFIVITQYKNFSDEKKNSTFESLRSEMLENYSEHCLGVIFFSNSQSDWTSSVAKIIKGAFNENSNS
ncbi:response regulator transcription factor [Alteromonas macleodii]|uniref:response regulator transcription factor n=1 Tax=Alteromonas macleodii TaxID=28108 RepID=UPI003BF8F244